MKITKNTVVTLTYRLTDAQGEFIEQTEEPMVYLHGGYDGIFPRIEEALEGHEAGFKTDLALEPDDAFGDYDADQVRVEPRSKFPEPLEIGMRFEGVPEDPDEDVEILTVTDLTADTVVLDANHPLAGVGLRFAVEVLDVRAASEDEIEHEHAHGAHGHDHDHEHDHEHDDDFDEGATGPLH
jgi:FKBP-type peptidyl-prolyl cis-trans isomerase SlyD